MQSHVYTCTSINIHTHTHTHTHTHIHTHVHTHAHTHMHVYTHIHMYTHMLTHTYIHTYTDVHTHTYTNHIHMHTYTYHTWEMFGRGRSWQIVNHSPKASSPIFTDTSVEMYVYGICTDCCLIFLTNSFYLHGLPKFYPAKYFLCTVCMSIHTFTCTHTCAHAHIHTRS